MRRSSLCTLAACVTTALVLAGCAEPVQVGAARPSSASLGLAPDKDEVVNATLWPDACEYLTDEEIRAILPSAKEIARTPTPVEVLDIGGDGTQSGTASAGSCDYDIELPTTDIESAIYVTTAAVAHPKLVERHYREEKADDTESLERAGAEPLVDHGERFGADACYSEPSTNDVATFTCRSGALMFEVWGQTFATFEGVPEDQSERHWQDRVLPEVIETVAAKTRAS